MTDSNRDKIVTRWNVQPLRTLKADVYPTPPTDPPGGGFQKPRIVARMAVNEKPEYAATYTTHAGKLYRPGEQLSGRLPDGALAQARESGLTTSSHAEAQRHQSAERARVERVRDEIANRSEKRDNDKQHGREVVQMPDGTFRLRD